MIFILINYKNSESTILQAPCLHHPHSESSQKHELQNEEDKRIGSFEFQNVEEGS